MGLSQNTVAQSLGITFQQIQKYERGTNRIVASRLFRLAQVLQVPVQYFFMDLAQAQRPSTAESPGRTGDSLDRVPDLLSQRDTLRLVQAFSKIEDVSVRRQIYALVRTVGESDRIPDC
ncbi:helix-turn-helix transcriptional regulator [Pelagibius litoralis]|uniref:Helix-turn-helix transcriptional regulator n=2 Tax=Pelagibius litoralis TaxID=374515 RepID=A0A967K9V4_9PROT|nr:helix-turn-helix transcriptional regulator [Pelagibius litoralis]